jgi:hypothetical protein
MVNSVLDRVIQFFQEPANRERIQTQCLDPLLKHILDHMFPYIILTCIIFSLILLMSLTSVGLLLFQLHAMSKPGIMPIDTSLSALGEGIGEAIATGTALAKGTGIGEAIAKGTALATGTINN